MQRRFDLFALPAIILMADCGSHGSGGSAGFSPHSDPEVSIIATDTGAQRIVSVDDMSGSGWRSWSLASTVPYTVCVDRQGRIYFTDPNNHRVGRVDDLSGANPVFYTPSAAIALNFGPYAIFVDAANHITISDGANNQILRVDDMSGANPLQWGTVGSGDFQFAGPRGVYVRSDGAMYVADYNNQRVVEFSEAGSNWPSQSVSGGPIDVWLDAQDRIYVCDLINKRIVRMDDISAAGMTQFDHTASGDTLSGPRSIFVDHASGRIYITDQGHHRIVRMDDMTGAGWTTFGTSGDGDGQFHAVWDVKVTEAPFGLAAADQPSLGASAASLLCPTTLGGSGRASSLPGWFCERVPLPLLIV